MTKLLYITNGINGSGGLERVLSIKASHLAEKKGYEVHILTLNKAHKNPFYEFSNQIHFHSIEVNGNPFSYFIKYKKGIKNVLKKIEPNIISVCDDGFKGMLFPLLFGKKIPVIYERHVSKNIEQRIERPNFYKRLKLKFTYKLMNYAGGKFDKFILLTNGNKTEWKLKNIQIIPNPLPFKVTTKSTLLNKKVLVVGKQSFQKGYDRLLQIWKEVYKKYPDWQLEIYGKIESSLGYNNMLHNLGIEKAVRFYSPIKNIQEKYHEASIYAMTSRFEGFGMVLIEAMSFGVPCISFDCPHGPADIITNQKDGILIKNGDITSFSKELIILIEDEEKRQRLGAQASDTVRRYNSKNIISQWDSLFKSLII